MYYVSRCILSDMSPFLLRQVVQCITPIVIRSSIFTIRLRTQNLETVDDYHSINLLTCNVAIRRRIVHGYLGTVHGSGRAGAAHGY